MFGTNVLVFAPASHTTDSLAAHVQAQFVSPRSRHRFVPSRTAGTGSLHTRRALRDVPCKYPVRREHRAGGASLSLSLSLRPYATVTAENCSCSVGISSRRVRIVPGEPSRDVHEVAPAGDCGSGILRSGLTFSHSSSSSAEAVDVLSLGGDVAHWAAAHAS